MSLLEKSKPLLAWGLLILFMATCFFGAQFYIIQPLQKEVEQVKLELANEEQLVQILSERQQQNGTIDSKNTKELQQRLPVEPLIDQFLLDLEKAEVFSDSLILSYGINEGEASFQLPEAPELQNPLEQQQTPQPQQSQESALSQVTKGSTTADTMQGIKKVTFTLSVSSPSYKNMLEFLDRIENQKRVASIDSLNFAGHQESAKVVHDTKQGIQYSVQVSTFYIPEWKELAKDLPIVEYKEPHGKTNPMYPGEVKDESSSEEE